MLSCPDAVKRLIEKFNQQLDQVRSSDYNETTIRVEYIDPFMEQLGWDVNNSQGHALQYREVVHEDRVKVAGQTKAPDYSFRIGGQRKFFLEAKKPYVSIRLDSDPAYQLRRYAWSAKLALSLLTNFQDLAIYDARLQPKQSDKPYSRPDIAPKSRKSQKFAKRAVFTIRLHTSSIIPSRTPLVSFWMAKRPRKLQSSACSTRLAGRARF